MNICLKQNLKSLNKLHNIYNSYAAKHLKWSRKERFAKTWLWRGAISQREGCKHRPTFGYSTILNMPRIMNILWLIINIIAVFFFFFFFFFVIYSVFLLKQKLTILYLRYLLQRWTSRYFSEFRFLKLFVMLLHFQTCKYFSFTLSNRFRKKFLFELKWKLQSRSKYLKQDRRIQ